MTDYNTIYDGKKIGGHYWIEEKDGDRIIDAWYPCYDKQCEILGVAKKFRYSKCSPKEEKQRLAYIGGKMVKLMVAMKDEKDAQGAYPFHEDLIRSGRCMRNVAMCFLGMTTKERKKWKVCYGNMGWGEGEKYWMEFEEGTATMTSLKKDYERIGMKLSQLEIFALSVNSPLKNDELGVLNRFVLGDNMNEEERMLEEAMKIRADGHAEFEGVEIFWEVEVDEEEAITARANDMESLD